MSNAVASAGTSAGSATNTNSASGSRKRRMSHAQAARSMCTPARVAHFIGPPRGVASNLSTRRRPGSILGLLAGSSAAGSVPDFADELLEDVLQGDDAQLAVAVADLYEVCASALQQCQDLVQWGVRAGGGQLP